MCAEHRGGAHQDDEAKSEQFSLRGKKSPQARSQETQVGGSMGLWLGLGKIFTPEKYLPLKHRYSPLKKHRIVSLSQLDSQYNILNP